METFEACGVNKALALHLESSSDLKKPTDIQAKALSAILDTEKSTDGSTREFIIQSQTGSGKTLAYLIPIVNFMLSLKPNINSAEERASIRSVGCISLVIVPTRELATQIYNVVEGLLKCKFDGRPHWIVPGLLIGGQTGVKPKAEKAKIRKGINFLVATPGRLLYHLKNTTAFNVKNWKWCVFDEADRLMDLGFEEDIKDILKNLNREQQPQPNVVTSWISSYGKRNVILCSATIEKNLQKFCGETLVSPVYLSTRATDQSLLTNTDNSHEAVPAQLKQHILFLSPKNRFIAFVNLVNELLKQKPNLKIIVFFSCCDMVDFHYFLLTHLRSTKDSAASSSASLESGLSTMFCSPVTIYRLHGNRKQSERNSTFTKYRDETFPSILLCTDVAARGLDLPRVSGIIQFDAPTDFKDYVHRIGRTARIGNEGSSYLLLISPSEDGYVEVLKSCFILETKKFEEKSDEKGIDKMHVEIAKFIASSQKNTRIATAAFNSFVRAYATHPSAEKKYFSLKNLHLGHVAKSFGLSSTPKELGAVKSSLNSEIDEDKQPNTESDSKTLKRQLSKHEKYKLQRKRAFSPDILGEFSAGL